MVTAAGSNAYSNIASFTSTFVISSRWVILKVYNNTGVIVKVYSGELFNCMCMIEEEKT